MNLALIAPLMLGGAALLIAPFLIHRIRRPEREPIRFSSLLFIPDVKKEVIERRRIQHILLMLLRMAILVLLALAFARPFAKAAVLPGSSDSVSEHLILLDTSFSMAAGSRFQDAVKAAENIVDAVGPQDDVAVVAFGRSPQVLAPFASEADPDGGTVSAARAALRAATLTEEGTDYGSALRRAQELLLGSAEATDDTTRRVVYVVSDLQRSGMPDPSDTWKLSPSIELDAINVASTTPANFAIGDVLARRTVSDEVRIVAKVKNWSDEDVDVVPLKLVIGDKPADMIEKPIRAGNATQFSFTRPIPVSGVLAGYVELPNDPISQDNRRYFVWSPPAKHEVALVSADTNETRDPTNPLAWPASWFIQRGLPSGGEWPFTINSADPDSFAKAVNRPGGAPSAAIVCGTDGMRTADFTNLRNFVSTGGAALVLLDTTDTKAVSFASSLGLKVLGSRFENPSETQYDLLTWVDLDYPIFSAFQGHLYNDFSSLRFHQYVELRDPDADNVRTVARFESGAPAMVEVTLGDGTLIVWPFAVTLESTNLPKSPRFVPLLYETMRHLCRVEESESVWQVGDTLREDNLLFDESGQSSVKAPGETERIVTAGDTVQLDRPGILTISAAGATGPARVQSVNVDADESDLAGLDPGEFELKLASSPRILEETRAENGFNTEEASVAHEYGILFMALAVAGLLIESWYMSRLTARRRPE